jgi:nitric oxide reductase subunit B
LNTSEKQPLMMARGWIQAVAIVLIFGFFIPGILTYYTYNDEPPIPNVVKNTNGENLFARGDSTAI